MGNFSAHYNLTSEEAENYDFLTWEKMNALHKSKQRDGHYRNRNGTKGKNPNRTTQNRNSNGLDSLL